MTWRTMTKKRPRRSRKPARRHRRGGVRRAAAFRVLYLAEPALTFAHEQAVEDPRDGLMLFGPLDAGAPYGIRVGVIGTPHGIALYRMWVARIQGWLADKGSPIARPPFPGFQTVFRVPWGIEPVLALSIAPEDIERAVVLDDQHQRVYQTVSLYADRIIGALQTEDVVADVWFVVIPDIVHTNCRPMSRVPVADRVPSIRRLSPRFGRRLLDEPSMFDEDNIDAIPYHFEVDFHNQLKARVLGRAPTQILRESTLMPPDAGKERQKRDMTPFQAAVAWNISTATFYKAGGRPWKIHGIREGVCYVGLVFKLDERHQDPTLACCAAQMFLDSGDGVVFRGAVGPWYSQRRREYHLNRQAARELVGLVVSSYAEAHNGTPPRELFIHGRAFFSNEEWEGFGQGVDQTKTRLVGVRIREEPSLRVYRYGRRPVLRGTAVVPHEKTAYLFTKGFTPRLRTYVGREVPRPLRVDIARGEAEMTVVLADILALTKLNFNTCLFSDGMPVTLRFADAVGEILTAAPGIAGAPLSFRHYI